MKKFIPFFVMVVFLVVTGCTGNTTPSTPNADGRIVYKTGFYRDMNYPGKNSKNCYFPPGFKMQAKDGTEQGEILGVLDVTWRREGIARAKSNLVGNPYYTVTVILFETKNENRIEGYYAWSEQKLWSNSKGCERITATFSKGVLEFDLIFAARIQLLCSDSSCNSGEAKIYAGSKPSGFESHPDYTTGRFHRVQ